MSTDAQRPDEAPGDEDEKMRRALEIHRRLMREHNLEFYNRPDAPPAPPADEPAR